MLFLVLLNFFQKKIFLIFFSREDYAVQEKGDEDGVGIMWEEVAEVD